MTKFEKVLMAAFVVLPIATFALVSQRKSQLNELYAKADPQIYDECRKVAKSQQEPDKPRHLPTNFPDGKLIECLVERDPAFEAAHFASLCQEAKDKGLGPEHFKNHFTDRCFGSAKN